MNECILHTFAKAQSESITALISCWARFRCFRQAFIITTICFRLFFWIFFITKCSIFQPTWITHICTCPFDSCLPVLSHVVSQTLNTLFLHFCLTYHSKPNNHATSSMQSSLILHSGNFLPFLWLSTAFDLYISYGLYHFVSIEYIFVFVFFHSGWQAT